MTSTRDNNKRANLSGNVSGHASPHEDIYNPNVLNHLPLHLFSIHLILRKPRQKRKIGSGGKKFDYTNKSEVHIPSYGFNAGGVWRSRIGEGDECGCKDWESEKIEYATEA